MSRIAIVYYSGWEHTQRVAEHVNKGCGGEPIRIDSEGQISDAQWSTLHAADMIVLGSPTYMGGVSWQFKRFADASSRVWAQQLWKDKLFAGFTNSATMNGDKQVTLQYLQTLALQHGGLWVGTALMPSNKKASGRDDLNYVGSFAGLMTVSPADASADEIPAGDLHTAEAFGARLKHLVRRFGGREGRTGDV